MSPLECRTCRTCEERKTIGHFPPRGGGRSKDCHLCLSGVEVVERPALVESTTRLEGLSGRLVEVTFVHRCGWCGPLESVTVRVMEELLEAWRKAALLTLASTHLGCGQLSVEVKVK